MIGEACPLLRLGQHHVYSGWRRYVSDAEFNGSTLLKLRGKRSQIDTREAKAARLYKHWAPAS
jgi:hypothetical protein